MICEKCGKSNIIGMKKCRYCRAKMPEIKASSGFVDILSIDDGIKSELSLKENNDLEILLKNTNSIARSLRRVMILYAAIFAILLTIIVMHCTTA